MPAPETELDPETLLSTCQLAAHLRNQRGACRSNRETITRWIHRGVKIGSKRIKLPAIRQGGVWLVTWGDFLAWREATSAQATHAGYPPIVTPAEYKRRSLRAREEMEATFAAALGERRKKSKDAKRAS